MRFKGGGGNAPPSMHLVTWGGARKDRRLAVCVGARDEVVIPYKDDGHNASALNAVVDLGGGVRGTRERGHVRVLFMWWQEEKVYILKLQGMLCGYVGGALNKRDLRFRTSQVA